MSHEGARDPLPAVEGPSGGRSKSAFDGNYTNDTTSWFSRGDWVNWSDIPVKIREQFLYGTVEFGNLSWVCFPVR